MLTITIAVTGICLLATAVVARDIRPTAAEPNTTSSKKCNTWTTTVALLVLAWLPVMLVIGAVAHICR